MPLTCASRICGGLFGHYFIKLNIGIANLRRTTAIRHYPVIEVAAVAFLTGLASYLIPFLRVPTSDLVAGLFQDCSAGDPLGLCEYVLSVSSCREFSLTNLGTA